jgi:hypothetical protein
MSDGKGERVISTPLRCSITREPILWNTRRSRSSRISQGHLNVGLRSGDSPASEEIYCKL